MSNIEEVNEKIITLCGQQVIVNADAQQASSLQQRGGELIDGLLCEMLPKRSSETSFELNLLSTH